VLFKVIMTGGGGSRVFWHRALPSYGILKLRLPGAAYNPSMLLAR
jgi:hypothetical protein